MPRPLKHTLTSKSANLQDVASNCHLMDEKVPLELRTRFKAILEANLKVEAKGVSEPEMENWLPAMDSNHD